MRITIRIHNLQKKNLCVEQKKNPLHFGDGPDYDQDPHDHGTEVCSRWLVY